MVSEMNISVRFNVYDPPAPRERIPQLRFSWTKEFQSDIEDESILELALGYIYALTLVRRGLSSTIITFNGETTNNPFRFVPLRQRIIGHLKNPPKLGESPKHYVRRTRIQIPTMNYILLVSPDGTEEGLVDVLQFNHLTFLQGFLSVLAGFQQHPIKYIVTIYDINGVEYTIRR